MLNDWLTYHVQIMINFQVGSVDPLAVFYFTSKPGSNLHSQMEDAYIVLPEDIDEIIPMEKVEVHGRGDRYFFKFIR